MVSQLHLQDRGRSFSQNARMLWAKIYNVISFAKMPSIPLNTISLSKIHKQIFWCVAHLTYIV